MVLIQVSLQIVSIFFLSFSLFQEIMSFISRVQLSRVLMMTTQFIILSEYHKLKQLSLHMHLEKLSVIGRMCQLLRQLHNDFAHLISSA